MYQPSSILIVFPKRESFLEHIIARLAHQWIISQLVRSL